MKKVRRARFHCVDLLKWIESVAYAWRRMAGAEEISKRERA